MDFEIEKGIPIPEAHSGRNAAIYPFGSMRVGESFSIPLDGAVAKRVQVAASQYGRRTKTRFTTRTLRDQGLVRVWRIE